MSVSFDRALLALTMQPDPDTYVNPSLLTDALLVKEPVFNPEIQRIQREVVRASLSPIPGRTGRIRSGISFKHDLIGSGNTDGTVPPVLDKVLRACGLAQTAVPDAGFIQSWSQVGTKGEITISGANTTYAAKIVRYVRVEVTATTGAGNATVDITVPANTAPDGTEYAAVAVNAQVLANDTDVDVGEGCSLNFDAIDVQVGDVFFAQIAPPGYLYSLVSVGYEAASLELYYDGVVHRSGNCRGNLKMEATAGDLAMLDIELQGDWQDPVDIALPENAKFSDLVPPQVELADVRVDNLRAACPSKFGFDLANEIAVKECANSAQGYEGADIVGRAPKFNFDPSFGPESQYAYWAKLRGSDELDFSYTIGTELGNCCHVLGHTQITNLQYGDRNKQRIYNVELDGVSRDGNNEVSLYFF